MGRWGRSRGCGSWARWRTCSGPWPPSRATAPGDAALRQLAAEKTLARLETFARDTGWPIDKRIRYGDRACPSLVRIAEQLASAMDLRSGRREVAMHGDLCFSNLLWDSRNRRIKAIDPRGAVDRAPTLHGDLRYDLAKLAHSVVGRYDQIIAGRYALSADGEIAFDPVACQPWLEGALADLVVDGQGGLSQPVRAVMASLFLSMLPLHADRPDRQQAFLANALRLWCELDGSLRAAA
ncbi:phosphotransferase [Phenylobacterium sp. J367]|uniref:phosphotransferase n=1 Tax=Phenylobacterium sp. J367 TaxID=2898435 RepID=UPI002150B75A|nr:phosphotransferase [Phenylobacterium sp. J367]MCR5879219.1 phosphotransferase [Phenylobacterium sp. J367]